MRTSTRNQYAISGAIFSTPFGWAGVAASEQGICKIVLPKKEKKAVERELKAFLPQHEAGLQTNMLKKAVRLLTDYFSGKHVVFDLPRDTRLYTSFQQAVWNAALEIPYGETRPYAWIAKKIKRPKASRAVGQALGANPIAIIIPCHRVVSSSGSLGGYAGGLVMKQALLKLEQK